MAQCQELVVGDADREGPVDDPDTVGAQRGQDA
jgi:hypothetical protein